MKRTAIYLRVSTSRQAEEGDSIPAQRDALRKYIDDHEDMIFAGEYLDDGVSGTKIERDELQRLLDDVKAGKIDLILVVKLDRWFRSIRHYVNTQELLDKHNVGWLAIWEPIYDSTTPQGRLIINQMMSIAQFEAENTGQRIRQVMAFKLSQGEAVSGRQPWGYDIKDKRLVPNENADAARKIFEYFDRTGNKSATIRYARGLGYLCSHNSLTKMLMQTKYTGEYRGIKDYCPPIVTRELFESVQRKLGMNIKCSATQVYIFSGLIVCAECGLRFTSSTNGRGTKRYRCQGKYSRVMQVCGNTSSISETVLERYLAANVKEKVEDLQARAQGDAKKQTDTTAQTARIERRLARLKDLYLDGEISMDEYKADKSRLMDDLAALKEVEPPKDYSGIIDYIGDDLDMRYWSMTEEERRNFWRGIIRQITIDKDRNIAVEFFSG